MLMEYAFYMHFFDRNQLQIPLTQQKVFGRPRKKQKGNIRPRQFILFSSLFHQFSTLFFFFGGGRRHIAMRRYQLNGTHTDMKNGIHWKLQKPLWILHPNWFGHPTSLFTFEFYVSLLDLIDHLISRTLLHHLLCLTIFTRMFFFRTSGFAVLAPSCSFDKIWDLLEGSIVMHRILLLHAIFT